MELEHVPCTEHALRSGDRVLLYTDGITERRAEDGTMYEQERLTASLTSVSLLRPPAIIEHLMAELDAFAGGHEPDDDQTLVIVGIGS
jgi:sigma-B regulation protein RsbU (phosphoserine phosphatase)